MSSRLPAEPNGIELARFTNERWNELDNFYRMWGERWKRTTDFIRSLHWQVLQQIDIEKLPKWKHYSVVNFILASFSDYMSQWLQSDVRFSAVPDNPLDPQDISAAELADQLLRYFWDKLEIGMHKVDLGAWLLSTGNGATKVCWDTNTGDKLPLAIKDKNGNLIPINPETMQPDPSMGEPVMVDAGEIALQVLSPLVVRTPINTAHGKMVGFQFTYDEVLEKYGKEIAEKLSYKPMDSRLSVDFVGMFPAGQKDSTATIIEHYLPRSSRYGDGMWWTSSEGKIIVEPAALPGRYIPIVNFRWIPMPGHPDMGMSPLYDMTFSNKAYDIMLSRSLEWMDRVIPKIIRQTGDGLPTGYFDDEPGQEAVVAQGLGPAWMNPTAPPEQLFKLKTDVADDLATVGGYKFQRQRQLPAGEATQRFRAPTRTIGDGEQVQLAIMNSEHSWRRLGYILLDYASTFYGDGRVISVVGADKVYQYKEFKGTDLKNLQATLHIDKQSLYTWNRQSLRDTVIGVLGTPAAQVLFMGEDGQIDKDRINAAMNAAGIDVSPEALDMDIVEAKNEHVVFQNIQSEDDPAPTLQSWQNNAKHYAEHVKVPKSVTFRGWSDPAKKAFLKHIEDTQQALQQAAQAQEQSVITQEKQLRDIRAAAETSQDVRTEFGKQLVDLLVSILTEQKKTPNK
jgi:hypothetical protein